jgi:hypothetical protein
MDKAIRGGREKEGIVRKEKDSYPTLNQAENRKESDEDDTMAGIRNKQGTGYLFFFFFLLPSLPDMARHWLGRLLMSVVIIY